MEEHHSPYDVHEHAHNIDYSIQYSEDEERDISMEHDREELMNLSFEEAIEELLKQPEDDFMLATRMLITVLHNLWKNPTKERFKKLRTDNEIIQDIISIPFVHASLIAARFEKQENCYLLAGAITMNEVEQHLQTLVDARKTLGLMEAWEIFPADLVLGEKIGGGKFGAVFDGEWNKQKVAIKTLKTYSEEGMCDFEQEAAVMIELRHPNVLALLGVVLTQQPALIILELMGTSFLQLLKICELKDSDTVDCALQVAAGMDYVHSKGFLHCDLACRNVLVSPLGALKISDFGLARRIGSEECNLKGTKAKFPIRWTAPEVFKDQVLSPASDVWSYGILFWEIVTAGDVPYAELTNKEAKKAVKGGQYPSKPEKCAKDFYSVMCECWAFKAKDRPAFQDIVQTLLAYKVKIAHKTTDFRQVKEVDVLKGKKSKGRFGWFGFHKTKRKELTSPTSQNNLQPSHDVTVGPDALVSNVIRVNTVLLSEKKTKVALKISMGTKTKKLIAHVLQKLNIPDLDAKDCCIVEVGTQNLYQRKLQKDEYPLSLTTSPFYSTLHELHVCTKEQGKNIFKSFESVRSKELQQYQEAVKQAMEERMRAKRVDMTSLDDDDDHIQQQEDVDVDTTGINAEDHPWFKQNIGGFGHKIDLPSAVYESTKRSRWGRKKNKKGDSKPKRGHSPKLPGFSEALYEPTEDGSTGRSTKTSKHKKNKELSSTSPKPDSKRRGFRTARSATTSQAQGSPRRVSRRGSSGRVEMLTGRLFRQSQHGSPLKRNQSNGNNDHGMQPKEVESNEEGKGGSNKRVSLDSTSSNGSSMSSLSSMRLHASIDKANNTLHQFMSPLKRSSSKDSISSMEVDLPLPSSSSKSKLLSESASRYHADLQTTTGSNSSLELADTSRLLNKTSSLSNGSLLREAYQMQGSTSSIDSAQSQKERRRSFISRNNKVGLATSFDEGTSPSSRPSSVASNQPRGRLDSSGSINSLRLEQEARRESLAREQSLKKKRREQEKKKKQQQPIPDDFDKLAELFNNSSNVSTDEGASKLEAISKNQVGDWQGYQQESEDEEEDEEGEESVDVDGIVHKILRGEHLNDVDVDDLEVHNSLHRFNLLGDDDLDEEEIRLDDDDDDYGYEEEVSDATLRLPTNKIATIDDDSGARFAFLDRDTKQNGSFHSRDIELNLQMLQNNN